VKFDTSKYEVAKYPVTYRKGDLVTLAPGDSMHVRVEYGGKYLVTCVSSGLIKLVDTEDNLRDLGFYSPHHFLKWK
jgi:hypothetical protein